MNHHEFEKKNPFKNDMKRKFNENVEFSREFIEEITGENKLIHESNSVDEDFLCNKRKKYKKKKEDTISRK